MPDRERNLAFWGLVAFAVCSPVSIAATNAAWVTTLFLSAYQVQKERPVCTISMHRTALDKGFGLFFLASALSLCVSLQPLTSLKELRSLGLVVVYYLFAWNVKTRRQAGILLGCWLGMSALAAAYGVVEFLSGWDLLGHYDPRSNQIGGFFSMHLTFAEYLLLSLSICAAMLLWCRPLQRRTKALLVAAFLLMLVAVFLSKAKGAILGMLVGGSAICALKGKRALALMWAMVALPLILYALQDMEGLYHELVVPFLVDANHIGGYVESNTQRLFMWWTGFRISIGHFLNGVGLHAVEGVYPSFRHWLAKAPNQWHLHSNFIDLGVTQGLFGLGAFLYLFLLACRNSVRRFRTSTDNWEKALSAGVFGACVSFLVSGLTEYSWADSEVLMALYMVLGLGASHEAAEKHPSAAFGFVPRRSTEPKKGTDLFSPPFSTPQSDLRPEKIDPSPFSRKAPFATLAILLCVSSLVLPGLRVNVGNRILEVLLGFLAVGIAVTRPFHRSPAPPWYRQMLACVVVFAGYHFTGNLWMTADAALSGSGLVVPIVLVLVPLQILFLAFLVDRRRSLLPLTLFDVSLLGAIVLWESLSFGTNLLLFLASPHYGPLGPPFTSVFLLCTFVMFLYGTARLQHCGGRVYRVLLASLGACMILQAITPLP